VYHSKKWVLSLAKVRFYLPHLRLARLTFLDDKTQIEPFSIDGSETASLVRRSGSLDEEHPFLTPSMSRE
jgi:hypothetical protein